jgi:hypothetical protein
MMPRYKESGWVDSGADSIPGVGKSAELVEKIFGLDMESPLLAEVVQVGDRWFIVQLIERKEPSDDEFATKKPDLTRMLEGEKKLSMFSQWIDDLRAKAEQKGAIEINQSYLSYGIEQAEEGETKAPEQKAD